MPAPRAEQESHTRRQTRSEAGARRTSENGATLGGDALGEGLGSEPAWLRDDDPSSRVRIEHELWNLS